MDVKRDVEPADPAPEDEPGPAGRGHLSSGRRIMITIFVVVTVGAVLVQNMPDSTIKEGLVTVARPYLNASGLDQSWSIFSPNPRARSVYVLARIERVDGSVSFRPLPTSTGPASYWEYRWRKFGERLSRSDGQALRRPYAEWVVDQDRRAGGEPVRVTLVRRTARNLPPGPGVDARSFVDEDFYTAPVSAR